MSFFQDLVSGGEDRSQAVQQKYDKHYYCTRQGKYYEKFLR